MNRLLLSIISVILFSHLLFAQMDSAHIETDINFELSLKEMNHSLKMNSNQHKLMLIMYDPAMYLPDPAGDSELAKEANKDMEYIRKRIRFGLDVSLYSKVGYLYETVDLMKEYVGNASNDSKKIYSSVSYKYNTPNRLVAENKKSLKDDEGIINGQVISRSRQIVEKYVTVSIEDPTLLTYLNHYYGTDLFLFITQIEIKKLFKDQLDLSYGIYERQVKVHYALYDLKGSQLAGDVVEVVYSSATNDIEEIMKHSFPDISKKIASSLPQPFKTANEIASKNRVRSARKLNKKSR